MTSSNHTESKGRARLFVRNDYGANLLEDFFIAAVFAVLAIRLYLHLTGYPQVGGGGLHIAHLLWGGLLMLVGLVMLLSFLNRSSAELGAIIGGLGFGAFIDELGKFVTQNNDYFYQPTVALIYIVFVVLFLSIQVAQRFLKSSQTEALANVLEITKQAVINGLSTQDLQRALALLEQCDPEDPVVQALEGMLDQFDAAPAHQPNLLVRGKQLVLSLYQWAVARWWFSSVVIGVFVLQSLGTLYQTIAQVAWTRGLALWLGGGILAILVLVRWSRRRRFPLFQSYLSVTVVVASVLVTWILLINLKHPPSSLLDWGELVFPTLSSTLVALGILLLNRSRLEAYRMFRMAVLISILLSQVFAFYQGQFLALGGLVVDIIILATLRYVIEQEEGRLKRPHGTPAREETFSHVYLRRGD